jgi:hypothetical protein
VFAWSWRFESFLLRCNSARAKVSRWQIFVVHNTRNNAVEIKQAPRLASDELHLGVHGTAVLEDYCEDLKKMIGVAEHASYYINTTEMGTRHSKHKKETYIFHDKNR